MNTVTAPPRVPTAARLLPSGLDRGEAAHRARYGPLPEPTRRGQDLIAQIEASGLTGRGGAAFPTAIKLSAARRARVGLVIANGTEGEPASRRRRRAARPKSAPRPGRARDRRAPHRGLRHGSRDRRWRVRRRRVPSPARDRRASAGRAPPARARPAAVRGRWSAVVSRTAGGRPSRPGDARSRALVQNVETLAR